MGGLIEVVRQNKLLDSVTIPRQWNHQENINTWGTHQGNIRGGDMQTNGVYSGNIRRPTILYPYSTQAIKGIQNLQGKVRQTQNLEHRYPVLVNCLAEFLQKYSTPYFAKVLVARNKGTKYLPTYGETYMARGKCACITFWKNAETPISRSIMHRKNVWIHNMQPMYAQ